MSGVRTRNSRWKRRSAAAGFLRLHRQPFGPDDVAAFAGHAHRHERKCLGCEPETHAGRGDPLRPDSSDYTASPSDPMMWLRSQVTRTDMKGNVWGANQKLTLEEAIRCGTINGAHATFEEKKKGSIEPGKLADLVVLADDPFKTEPLNLHKIGVERTMVGGQWVYES